MKRSYNVLPVFLLFALTLLVFGQVIGFEFLNYDDDHYITKSEHRHLWGTWEGFKWALTYTGTSNWHPMVWYTFMLDHAVYGLKPWGYHLTNLLLHLANGLLCFLIFYRMTGALWRSFFMTALFVVHPLRAESVAWVVERKDVLSGFFFFLTLASYLKYTSGKKAWYVITLIVFTLGIMSKTMLVTVPFILLLLDYWPLNRFSLTRPPQTLAGRPLPEGEGKGEGGKLLLEKIPFFLPVLLACFMAISSRFGDEAMVINEQVPFLARFGNAFVFYISYIQRTLLPYQLTFFYPYPLEGVPLLKILASFLGLLGISLLAFLKRKSNPGFFVGWIWFVLMLVPVIGWLHIGSSSTADRYTYLPHVGVWMAAVWGLAGIFEKYSKFRLVPILLLICFSFLGFRQVSYWKDNKTLYSYALKVNPKNFAALMNLGTHLKNNGQYDKAIEYFQEASLLRTRDGEPILLAGVAFYQKGEVEKAIPLLMQSLGRSKDSSRAHEVLAEIYADQGKLVQAESHFKQFLKENPNHAQGHYNYGNLLLKKNQYKRAEAQFRQAIQNRPDYIKAINNLGNVLAIQRRYQEAEKAYRQAIALDPNAENARKNLQLLLSQMKLKEL